MITFACVRTGAKYGPEYVERLRNMIDRCYDGLYRFVCLTDQPWDFDDLIYHDISKFGLLVWWAKLVLFRPTSRRGVVNRVIYLDLDTVIVGDLTPFVEWDGDFGICENFTALAQTAAGHKPWPCRYGSCVMSFAPGWGQDVWEAFDANRGELMRAARHGDQSVIETLVPDATLLQNVMPPGFFLNKRDLQKYPDAPPPGAAVVVFGGRERPDNCQIDWVKRAWT